MLAEIRKRVEALIERQTRLWSRDLCPALAGEGIVVTGVAELTEESWSSSRRGSSRRSIPC